MRYYRRPTGVALGAVLLALIFVFIGICALTATPVLALTLTADQEQALTDYADQMTELRLDSEYGQGVEIFNPSLDAYIICDYSSVYTNDYVNIQKSLGESASASIHNTFTSITLPSKLAVFSGMGIDEINIIGIMYSQEGNIIYLSINGTDMSDLANFS